MRLRHKPYDELAPVYERRWDRYIRTSLDFAIDGMTLPAGARILDIACGTGALELRLIEKWPGLAIYGVDRSGPMIDQARAKVLSGQVHWQVADAHALPCADASFSHVFCLNSLHYFAEPDRVIRECARVLRRKGELVLVDWCDDYWTCKVCSLWLRVFEPAFQKTYGLAEARALVTAQGFEIYHTERRRISPLWGLMRLHAVRA